MDGQMSIFDFLKPELKAGEWVTDFGERVLFDDIQVGQYYIADYSTTSHKWYKVVYTKWKRDDCLGYIDDERGKKKNWTWRNGYACLTRKMYVDHSLDKKMDEASTNGWFYLMP